MHAALAIVLLAASLDPGRVYPIYAVGDVSRNGGAWMPAGTFAPSRRASIFDRQPLRVRLTVRGNPSDGWVVRALPQIDEISLTDPKTGTTQRSGMRVPFDARPILFSVGSPLTRKREPGA